VASTKTHCSYQYSLNSHIHKFTFEVADEKAVDDFFVALKQAIEEHNSDEPLKMHVDLRPNGIPPFAYTLATARDFFSNNDTVPMRAAYVYESSTFLSIIKNFFSLLRLKNQRKFFQNPDEHDVMNWLLERE